VWHFKFADFRGTLRGRGPRLGLRIRIRTVSEGSQLDRDAKAYEVAGGYNEILENTIAKALIKAPV